MAKAIKVENISKAYQLGEFGTGTISRDLERWWAKARGKEDPFLKVGEVNDRTVKSDSNVVWSLKDVNFEIEQGDAIGIIGRNGAGKSTLLKILSRITAPTTGSVKIKGRVASLLEVGTGFHPELTGKENIYLNGAILGMRKKEITRKFDEIVDFSGVERYIDTPVKRYSSGMYVRLAFAVAAYLESEILIVDEVLAVGDAEFQKKCLGKMGDISKGDGRTILFVSHNIGAIKQLCNNAILLNNGTVRNYGKVDVITSQYATDFNIFSQGIGSWDNSMKTFHNPHFSPIRFELKSVDNQIINYPIQNDVDFYIQISFIIEELDPGLTVGYALYNEQNELLFWSYQTDTNEENWPKLKKGKNSIKTKFPKQLVNEGRYRIMMTASIHYKYWILEPEKNTPELTFEIVGGLSESPLWIIKRPGVLAPVIQWQLV